MSKDLSKLKKNVEVREPKWTTKKFFQFSNSEAQEIFEKNPEIKWAYGEAALDFFRQGIRPSQFDNLAIWRGQGFVYIIPFFKTKNGQLIGIIELIPATNKDDHLTGKTAEGKDFEYKGRTYGVHINQPIGGSTGILHKLGREQVVFFNPELYSLYSDDERIYDYGIPTAAGGFFVGESQLIGEFRVNSGTFNDDCFRLNPLFLLCYCDNSKVEADNSDFWYGRIMPLIISDSLLEFLLKTLPPKDGQESLVTMDYRSLNAKGENIEAWLSLSESDLQSKLEDRLFYFSKTAKKDRPGCTFYNVSQVLTESKEQKIGLCVNVVDENGRTPLSYCLENGLKADTETLLMHNADPLIQDTSGKIAFDYDEHKIILPILKKLIRNAEADKDFKAADNFNFHYINYYCRKIYIENYMWVDGTYVKSTDADEIFKKPFQLEVIRKQLKHEPLFHVIITQSPHLTYDLLATFSIDLTVRNKERLTAFDCFLKKSGSHIDDADNLRLFVKKRADFTVEWQVPIPLQPMVAEMILADAAKSKFDKFLLVKQVFDLNLPETQNGLRLLHNAAITLNLTMLGLLLKSGANPDLPDNLGNTPLHVLMIIATRTQNPDIQIKMTKRLLMHGKIDIAKRNDKGQTAADLAPDFLKPLIVAALKERGFSNNQHNFYYSTPSQISGVVSSELTPGAPS